MGKLLWEPSAERIQNANMTAFIHGINQEYDQHINDYNDLWQWSVTNIADFWQEMWTYGGVIASTQPTAIIDNDKTMPGSRWFEGARLNFAENLLRYRDRQTAIIFYGEDRARRELSYNALFAEVSAVAAALKSMGVTAGDRVAGFMPNLPETIIAMLAATSLGATWSSCSPDFGIKGVLDRFGQIKPRVLFTADGYWFKGKRIDSLDRVRKILEQIDSVEKVVVVPYARDNPDLSQIPCSIRFHDFKVTNPLPLEFEQLHLRPSPLHHVLFRYNRSAQMHGPERRRHPAATDEGTPAAHGSEAGGHHLLFHDLRLDDVELADLRPIRRRHPGTLRWQSLSPRSRHPMENGRGRKNHRFRHQRRLPVGPCRNRLETR